MNDALNIEEHNEHHEISALQEAKPLKSPHMDAPSR